MEEAKTSSREPSSTTVTARKGPSSQNTLPPSDNSRSPPPSESTSAAAVATGGVGGGKGSKGEVVGAPAVVRRTLKPNLYDGPDEEDSLIAILGLPSMLTWRFALKAVAVTIGAFFVTLFFLYLAQDTIVYATTVPANSRFKVESPGTRGMEFEEVFIPTYEEDVKLHSYFFPAPSQRTTQVVKSRCNFEAGCSSPLTFVHFHGNAGNIGHRLSEVKALQKVLDVAVVLVEYRGFGKSGGNPSEEGMSADGDAVLEYLTRSRGLALAKLVLYGKSLGGAVSVKVASRWPALGGLIVENSFTSLPDMLPFVLYPLPASLGRWAYPLFTSKWEASQHVSALKMPALFIVSELDEIIPTVMTRSLFSQYGGDSKVLFMAKGASHNAAFLASGYHEAIRDFFHLPEVVA